MGIETARKDKQHKMRNRFIFRTIVLAILIAAVIFAVVTNFNKDKELFTIGDEAPNFSLTQINDSNELENIKLSDLRGKGVMLNFWATYCKPCEAEIPYMQSLYEDYGDKGIEIVAVSLDLNEKVIHDFIGKHEITFPVVHDKTSEVMDLYKIGPIPSTLFIDADGIIVDKVDGALTLERLEGHFQEIQP